MRRSRVLEATLVEFDAGPPPAVAAHFAALPSYEPHRDLFWYDWGPVFYRGRLDRSARLLALASDPGPTERIACRTLVGDAGQRVQGFLGKLGLTRGYLLLNAFAYALLPSRSLHATPILAEPAHREWREALFDRTTGPELQAIVAFGAQAREAVDLWEARPEVPVVEVPHPSSRDAKRLLDEWREAIVTLRGIVAPDADGTIEGPNYGATFAESDYAAVPRRDLPFGLPWWLGDDTWGRAANPRRANSVERPKNDLMHTLVWRSPTAGRPR